MTPRPPPLIYGYQLQSIGAKNTSNTSFQDIGALIGHRPNTVTDATEHVRRICQSFQHDVPCAIVGGAGVAVVAVKLKVRLSGLTMIKIGWGPYWLGKMAQNETIMIHPG